ncbi:MAG: putative toxin-antitoxin system toxin component, PIN family [Nitrospira sp.]|nr:putative toxin-antitoxin system toxin component, PIN family [Nitrospira sp.]MBH0180104.1 putative toxin-antitoxin system toxin component, PIN family [Nitrospira sp.]MBH0185328.1 putative toxin-antitoxin system toxin component, PIN family [Nitrospira sp.]
MRVILDTNIFVSGLLSEVGPPARIVQAVLQRRIIPIMSSATFAELNTVVHRPKLQRAFARAGVNLPVFLATVQAETQFVAPNPTSARLRDERDRLFLDLMATDPPPQYFVTGDKDFEATHYSGVPVISAAEFARLLTRR